MLLHLHVKDICCSSVLHVALPSPPYIILAVGSVHALRRGDIIGLLDIQIMNVRQDPEPRGGLFWREIALRLGHKFEAEEIANRMR